MDIVVLGIDLGKNSCSLAGLDASGRVVLRRRMRRSSVESFVAGVERCIVAMEACCGAHHLGRVFAAQGHAVRLMSPEYVRPYVKAQKNDELDAEAIAEAARRPKGGKPRLLGISKRGNRYLRKNLIHGARAALPYLVERETPLGRWARGLLARAHKNVVVVALANKLARIAWAVLAHGCTYEAGREATA
jgi:transposase